MKNKSFNFFAVAMAVVVLLAACAKDDESLQNEKVAELRQSIMPATMDYSILEQPETTVVSNDQVYDYLNDCLELFARNAFIAVNINAGDPTSTDITLIAKCSALGKTIQAKFGDTKMQTLTTGDKEKMGRWSTEMSEQGYIVVVTYDERTGKYTGVVDTKWE